MVTTETDREHERIWRTLDQHTDKLGVVGVLVERVGNIADDIKELKGARKWAIAQFIATLSVIATVFAAIYTR